MIFIIGGNGFVGSAFVRYCMQQQIEYQIITKKNYDKFVGQSCDILINANGNSSKLLSKKEPYEDFTKTVGSVKKSLIDFDFHKYVLVSSCDVYSNCSSPNITLESSEIDVSQQNPYGFHKYLAEQCVIHSTRDWLIVRLGGMVGIGLKKNAIFDIIHGGPLWLDPSSKLQFMNTNDVAKTIFELINQGISGEIFNVCGDGLAKLQDILDKFGHVKISPNSPTVEYNVNIEKVKKKTKIPNSIQSVFEFIEHQRRDQTN